MNLLLRLWQTGIVGSFLTGLFVLLPIMLTLLIIEWFVGKLKGALGPGTFFGELLTSGGSAVLGPNHNAIAFWLGLAFALAGIWTIGVIVKGQARRGLSAWLDNLFSSVPLLRTIYRPVSQVVRMLGSDKGSEFKGMTVVMCRFGGDGGAEILALLTTQKVYEFGGNKRVLVYLPTSPLPMSGGLVFVAESSVTPVPDMDVDDLMKIYFSLGALGPDAPLGAQTDPVDLR